MASSPALGGGGTASDHLEVTCGEREPRAHGCELHGGACAGAVGIVEQLAAGHVGDEVDVAAAERGGEREQVGAAESGQRVRAAVAEQADGELVAGGLSCAPVIGDEGCGAVAVLSVQPQLVSDRQSSALHS